MADSDSSSGEDRARPTRERTIVSDDDDDVSDNEGARAVTSTHQEGPADDQHSGDGELDQGVEEENQYDSAEEELGNVGEDDEGEEEEEEESRKKKKKKDKKGKKSKKSKKRKMEQPDGRPSKTKKRRNDASRFLDDDVDVTSGEEEEEYDEYGERPQIDDEETKRLYAEYDRKKEKRQAALRGRFEEIEGRGVQEDEEEGLDYGYDEDGDQQMVVDIHDKVQATSLLPDSKDPKLFLVKCRIGSERNAALTLMRKFTKFISEGRSLPIMSCFASNHIQGDVYVEARSDGDVRKAIQSVGLFYSNPQIRLIPLDEMTHVFNMDKNADHDVKPGQWVRVKRGPYAGDLAEVLDHDIAREKVLLKLVPRLDPTGAYDDNSYGMRPPKKLFNPQDFPDAIPDRSNKYRFKGMDFEEGFLHKYFHVRGVEPEAGHISMEEMEPFKKEAQGDEMREENLNSMLEKIRQKTKFIKGDQICVIKGELMNLTGKVIKVNDNSVIMQADIEEIGHPLQFPMDQISKHFARGDHVKVIGGKHEGEIGLITNVDHNMADLFVNKRDHAEIRVFVQDLQLTSQLTEEKSSAVDYVVGDMLQLNDNKSVGVVLLVENATLKLLLSNGEVVKVRKMQVMQKFTENRRAKTLDSRNYQVKIGDRVKILSGESKGNVGTVRQIYKDSLFLHSPKTRVNFGFFVEKARVSSLLGSELLRKPQPGSGRDQKNSSLEGKVLRVLSGPFKGYEGMVKSENLELVRFELTSKAKTVTIKRSDLIGADRRSQPQLDRKMVTKTPMYDGKSPAMTPNTGMVGASSAWDPTTPNSPGRTENSINDEAPDGWIRHDTQTKTY